MPDHSEPGHDEAERPDLWLIPGNGEDLERDPIDALADVLAGVDGDLDHARYLAQGVVETGTVPPTGPAEWLRRVLDEEARVAAFVTADLETYVWRGETLGWVAESDRSLARVKTERAILALHEGPHDCPGSPDRCAVVLWLAHGHRLDAEGWRPEWLPPGSSR